MNKMKEWLQRPLFTAITGLVVGLLIGLPLLGWLVWPVQWYDAGPQHLHELYQKQFLCMLADSYARYPTNADLMRERYSWLGDKGPQLLAGLTAEDCSSDLATIQSLKTFLGSASTASSAGQNDGVSAFPTVTAQSDSTPKNPSVGLLVLLCLVTLGVGAALFYFFVIRGRKSTGTEKRPAKKDVRYDGEDEYQNAPPPIGSPGDEPLVQFMTTYTIGDDLYDDSFSIDSATGEFLGECGIGISETVGVGDPKKVTAFEVWLFDKNDISTVTKILLSQHAFEDPSTRQRLMAKGELIQIQPGETILLETASLQLEVGIVDVSYGQSAMPANSYLDRLTLRLNVFQKN